MKNNNKLYLVNCEFVLFWGAAQFRPAWAKSSKASGPRPKGTAQPEAWPQKPPQSTSVSSLSPSGPSRNLATGSKACLTPHTHFPARHSDTTLLLSIHVQVTWKVTRKMLASGHWGQCPHVLQMAYSFFQLEARWKTWGRPARWTQKFYLFW